MSDEGQEQFVEDVTPDAPTDDVGAEAPTETLPEAEQPVDPPVEETPPAKPVRWFLVEYRALSGAVLPLEIAGKFWHANTQHVLAAPCFEKVSAIPGFRMIKDVAEPENAAGCAECGG